MLGSRLFTISRRCYAVRVSLSSKQSTGTRIIPNTEEALSGSSAELRKMIKESSPSAPGSTQLLYSIENGAPERKLLVNVKEDGDVNDFRSVIHKSIQHLRSHNVKDATLCLDDFPVKDLSKQDQVDHITRTAVLSGYEFSKYKKPKVRTSYCA